MIKISKLCIHPATIFVFFAVIYTNFSLYTLIIFTSALFHELGHILSIRAFGAKIFRIEILPFGVNIVFDNSKLTYKKELYSALLGPLCNLFLAVIFLFGINIHFCSYGFFALFSNLSLSFLNLLPIKTLDGGVALECILCEHLPLYKALQICNTVSNVFFGILLFFSLVLLYATGFNISFLFICIYLFFCIYIKDSEKRAL